MRVAGVKYVSGTCEGDELIVSDVVHRANVFRYSFDVAFGISLEQNELINMLCGVLLPRLELIHNIKDEMAFASGGLACRKMRLVQLEAFCDVIVEI